MKKKLLIASFALSGLVSAQCNMKCSYNQDENGNTIHIEKCNEYPDGGLLVKMERTQEYEFIHPKYVNLFNKVKTDSCCISKCLLVIRETEKDTTCMQHTPKINHLTVIPELPYYYYNEAYPFD